MAYASVASLLQTIDLVNYHHDSSISPRFEDQITSLHKHTTFLKSFLEESPKRANNWEETIRKVTDRAEEMIDLLVSDSLLKPSKSELNYSLDELEKVTEEMESVADRVQGRSTKAVVPDADLTSLISRLLGVSLEREIIAIVGMLGTGRSTLARNACNHPSIVEHFDVRAWATGTLEFSTRVVLLDLLHSMNIHDVESMSNEELKVSLYRRLSGKRYLIVLYDVPSIMFWDEVRRAFPDNRTGSRIVITTRMTSIAVAVGAHIHMMSSLDEDRSWNMLREKIFKGDPCPSQLEHVGKTIARRCKGILLLVELVSGILVSDQTEAAWEDVSENISSHDNH